MTKNYLIAAKYGLELTKSTTYFCVSPYFVNTTITFTTPQKRPYSYEESDTVPFVTLQYSTDCLNWSDVSYVRPSGNSNYWTWSITTSVPIYFKGINSSFAAVQAGSGTTYYSPAYFSFSKMVDLSGRISSIVAGEPTGDNITDCPNGFVGTPGPISYSTSGLFASNQNIRTIDNLILDLKMTDLLLTTSKISSNYYNLFNGCSNLLNVCQITSTPYSQSLSGSTMFQGCFQEMFKGCISITKADTLTLNAYPRFCCYGMFENCTSLKLPPKFIETTALWDSHGRMFYNCANLEVLPKLPATTLEGNCYVGMFTYCSKIKISETQTDEYQNTFRIPTTGTATLTPMHFAMDTANDVGGCLGYTGGTYKSTPVINTTYYTSNEVK